jgi:putative transcriptional regulator
MRMKSQQNSKFSPLSNQFLMAMPGLADPNFSRTLTYLCEHSPDGAMGIVINRPADLVLGEILDQLSFGTEDVGIYQQPVYQGGPMQPERGFVIHDDNSLWDSTLAVTDGISITTSKDILEAIAQGRGPKRILMALGYAGWSAGQLEVELTDNSWLTGPADPEIIFTIPAEQRLTLAARRLGVDFNLITVQAGHA